MYLILLHAENTWFCSAVDFIKMPAGTKFKTFQNCVI